MLNRSASLAMSKKVLKALPGKLDMKRYSPGILYLFTDVYVTLNTYRHDVKNGNWRYGYSEASVISDLIQSFRKTSQVR